MRQIAVIALIAALCVARVSAHSWMTSPVSRNGNQAVAGTGPCDAGGITARTQYNAGATITVTYATGGHGGNYISAVVASGSLPTTGAVTQTSNGVIAWEKDTFSGTVPGTSNHQLTIPADTPTGDYTIQYWWNNYYNCADIKVINPNTGGLGGSGTPGGAAPDSTNSTASAAAVGVIGGVAIAAVILIMAVLYKKGGCKLSSGMAVFPGAAAATTTAGASSAAARPATGPRPAAARPVAPLNSVSVAPRNGAASPRTMAAAVAMAGEPGERPLPPNWDTAVDDNGNVYYYHVHTNQVQWERPVA